MPKYNEVLKFTAHRNQDRFDGSAPIEKGKPNFGNGSIVLHSDLPAGEYSVSVWQYADSMNLGVNLSSVDRSGDLSPEVGMPTMQDTMRQADEHRQAADPAAPLPQPRRSFDDV